MPGEAWAPAPVCRFRMELELARTVRAMRGTSSEEVATADFLLARRALDWIEAELAAEEAEAAEAARRFPWWSSALLAIGGGSLLWLIGVGVLRHGW